MDVDQPEDEIVDTRAQRILIVDDAKANIRVLSDLLKDEGDVLFATDGEKAIEKAVEQTPDLILLDVMMPGLDGYEVCRRLKAMDSTKNIPVVFVTGKAEEADEELGLSIGAIDYITKPFAPSIVQARVRNHLELQRVTEELKVLNKELTRLATTDSLTGAFNRRHFMDQASAEVSRARRYGNPLTVMMLDIDHFKRVNDTYGHSIGDLALIQMTRTCLETLRTEDIFGRLGGEEFAAVLPETDLEGAKLTGERLREQIGRIEIETPAGPLKMTSSVGIGVYDASEDSVEPSLNRADEALYAAKKSGRNRVVTENEVEDKR